MSDYRAAARSRWPGAAIIGGGPFAVVSRCRGVLVTLYPRKEAATEAKRHMDYAGCGSPCWGQHSTDDLS